jgi:hypothetical protein
MSDKSFLTILGIAAVLATLLILTDITKAEPCVPKNIAIHDRDISQRH